MSDTDRPIDPLPEEFRSEDEASEFWDRHSIADYEEFLEPADFEADIKRRHFEIEVDEESFEAVRSSARKQKKPVKQLASEILKRSLSRHPSSSTPPSK
jgi:predicted DNA binding CopG/RHH family protein